MLDNSTPPNKLLKNYVQAVIFVRLIVNHASHGELLQNYIILLISMKMSRDTTV